jgi:uncharacterized protein YutE (UPF0331/DUF86 family)
MAGVAPSKVDRQRWQNEIIRHLEDFPRQYSALQSAMAEFGESFDLQLFKQAFETRDDIGGYNRVQSVERALSRVQNFVADLAVAGVKLAQLKRPPTAQHMSKAQSAFVALREAKVIDSALYGRLERAQKARTRIEHVYIDLSAGDVHRAAKLVTGVARDFIGPYRAWIGPYILDD